MIIDILLGTYIEVELNVRAHLMMTHTRRDET